MIPVFVKQVNVPEVPDPTDNSTQGKMLSKVNCKNIDTVKGFFS